MRGLVCGIAIAFVVATPVFADVKGVTVRDVGIFRYATNGSAMMDKIPKGTEVELLSPTSGYYEVATGWIARNAVQVTLVDGSVGKGTTYRSSPHDVDWNVSGKFSSATDVDIVAVVGDFCEVKKGKETVYVNHADGGVFALSKQYRT